MSDTNHPAPTVEKAMVLSAGLGKRMRPLTDDRPKPLVEVAGKPLLRYALDRLHEDGVETVVVNVHYMADQIEDYVAGINAPRVIISDERDCLLDTGGGIVRALPLLGEHPFIVINSDSIWIEGARPALERLRAAWRDDEMDCLLLLASTITSTGYDGIGDFNMDPDGQVRRRQENEVAPFVYAGVYIAHPRFFADAPAGPFSTNLLWDRAIEAGRLYGLRHDGIWLHVGTPEGVGQAERALREL